MRRVVNRFALALLVAAAVGAAILKFKVEGDRARALALAAQLDETREAVRDLRDEVADLEDPERLRALAEEELGLVPLDPGRVVTLEDAAVLAEPVEEDAQ